MNKKTIATRMAIYHVRAARSHSEKGLREQSIESMRRAISFINRLHNPELNRKAFVMLNKMRAR